MGCGLVLKRDGFVRLIFPAVVEQNSLSRLGPGGGSLERTIVQSWDTANKATELSDFSVCTTWGIKGKNLYLLGVLRHRLEYPALKRTVRAQQSLVNANVVLINDQSTRPRNFSIGSKSLCRAGGLRVLRRKTEKLRTSQPQAAETRGDEVQPNPRENQFPDLMEVYRKAREGYDSRQNTC
jgi:hypothetical protein